MKENMMRTPLIKAGAVLLVFVLLAYLTSASPEGSVLNSVGQLLIGAFRLVQWAFAMAIGLTVSIAVLVGIFLFAVSLVNKETAATMYQTLKTAVATFCQPLCSRFGCAPCAAQLEPTVTIPAAPEQTVEPIKVDVQAIVASEVRKVTENQQALSNQFSTLSSKIEALEAKSAEFAVAGQLDAIAADLTASGKVLVTVQEKVGALEGKINETVQQLHAITPEKMQGDIPARLQKLEQLSDKPGFDPAPLTASMETLQKEMEELKNKKSSGGGNRTKKKA